MKFFYRRHFTGDEPAHELDGKKEAVTTTDPSTVEDKAESSVTPSNKNEGTTEQPITVPILWYLNKHPYIFKIMTLIFCSPVLSECNLCKDELQQLCPTW